MGIRKSKVLAKTSFNRQFLHALSKVGEGAINGLRGIKIEEGGQGVGRRLLIFALKANYTCS